MNGHDHIVKESEGEKDEIKMLPKPKKISAVEWDKFMR